LTESSFETMMLVAALQLMIAAAFVLAYPMAA